MSHRILIVDDDEEFNLLLTEVFSQADYTVETARSAQDGLARALQGGFDLVVTDQRMPGISGLELVSKLRAGDPDLPIVMVSAFLESATIRELIRRGIGGVFMKPLNVFSLLKKADALISARQQRMGRGSEEANSGFGAHVGYPFRAFPCRDKVTRDFAERLYTLRNFSKRLLLVTEPGEEIVTIAEDLVSSSDECSRAVLLSVESFSAETVLPWLVTEDLTARRGFTFILPDALKATPEQRQLIYAITRGHGEFAAIETPRRFIFGVDRDLDAEFDEGLIDEDFYLFLGSNELKVPPLRRIGEDLLVMAETLLQRETPPRQLESAARAFLTRQPWPGNRAELSAVLRRAARLHRRPAISAEDCRMAMNPEAPAAAVPADRLRSPAPEAPVEAAASTPLEAYLRERRESFREALELLTTPLPLETAS